MLLCLILHNKKKKGLFRPIVYGFFTWSTFYLVIVFIWKSFKNLIYIFTHVPTYFFFRKKQQSKGCKLGVFKVLWLMWMLTYKLFQNKGLLHDTLAFDSFDELTINSLLPYPSIASLHAEISFAITFICCNRCAWQEDVVNK